ncbi:PqiC family protein [Alteromonas ponticola]|uniref:Membrane integrity-associated transporter subunit PqiC n=1 Tax=Alteromonas ponticola TaxID=2720613 RepID=A0ABX1R2H6_9ALTE|nr:ABC-type transport auxiliary lipoprotein family protein [Alteromonas ponticola]NMH59380.1 membrane integrity-associated transporter subunit PqiC [Alteromonas ponticola]
MKARWWLIAFVVVISGCASQSINLNYYLLHSPHSDNKAGQQPGYQLSLQKLVLPEYLKQRSLVMQTSPTTLHFSPQHVWAEPVQSGMIKALEDSLWQQHQILSVPAGLAQHNDALSSADVAIVVDDFLPTSDGQAVLRGKYWIMYADQSKTMHIFNLQRPLEEDGFDHAVLQMQQLVAELSGHIAGQLDLSDD